MSAQLSMLLAAVMCFVCLSEHVRAKSPTEPLEAKLVAKGDGYLVHVIPGSYFQPLPPFGLPNRFGAIPPKVVTHTSTQTGKMICLFASGQMSGDGPPMGINRVFFARWNLLVASASDEYLCLLTWHAQGSAMKLGGPMPIPKFGKGKCSLTVFDVRDGAWLASTILKDDQLPETFPLEKLNQGSLRVEANQITVLGQTWSFDGKSLQPIE